MDEPTIATPEDHPGQMCEDAHSLTPPWADDTPPDANLYVGSELFVAGAISTLPPFEHYHPAYALPIAREALDALSRWEPTDG